MNTMRRLKQQMEKTQLEAILDESNTGILTVNNLEGYPYPIPLNYVWYKNKIYFHSAKRGEKIESIKRNSRVCFCVVGQDRVIAEKFSTQYKSVVIFGQAQLIQDEKLKREVLEALIVKYCASYIERGQKEIDDTWQQVEIVEITIEKVTGKTASEKIMAIQ